MKDNKEVLEEIRKEYQVVSARLLRLNNYMITDEYGSLGFYMKEAFRMQKDGMEEYCRGLFRRIQHMVDMNSPKASDNEGFLL